MVLLASILVSSNGLSNVGRGFCRFGAMTSMRVWSTGWW